MTATKTTWISPQTIRISPCAYNLARSTSQAGARHAAREKPVPAFPWLDDQDDLAREKCAQELWNVALRLSGKFLADCGYGGGLPNYTKEDLAAEATLHVLIKAGAGKLRRLPPEERWPYIRRIIRNRVIDLATKHYEVQIGEGVVAAPPEDALRREEVRALEEFIDGALNALPSPCGLLIRLRFGIYRDDEFGSEFPHTGEPLSLAVLADAGYGSSDLDVHRRVQDALERLRGILISQLTKQQIRNFEGYHIQPEAA